MRKDAAAGLAAVIATVAMLVAVPAQAGTYDVVSCNLAGAGGENHSWALEPYNSAGKAVPDASNFTVVGEITVSCSGTAGIGFNPSVDRRAVKVDDGAGWTFRAPTGTLVRRVTVWRSIAARGSTDDPTTPARAENGWWVGMARAGTAAGGAVVIGGETCAGNQPTAPDTVFCRKGSTPFATNLPVTYDVGEPVVTWGLQCAGPTIDSYCFTGAGTPSSANAGLELHAATVTVEDTVAPELSGGAPEAAYRRTSDPLRLVARDSAGVRSLRVLVDGVERLASRPVCDYRYASPCPGRCLSAVRSGLPARRPSLHHGDRRGPGGERQPVRSQRRAGRDAARRGRGPGQRPQITALVSDALSGISAGAIAVRDRPNQPFRVIKTTVGAGKLTATVPASLSMSNLAIRVSATDKAGNTVTSAVTSMSISTRVGSRSSRKVQRSRASIPYGRTATVLGRLTTTDGAALAGQPIVITGTLRRTGATARPVLTATTDRSGRFSVRIPAGPSQNLTVSYPGGAAWSTATAPSPCSSRPARASARRPRRSAGPARSASPAACARSARPCRPAARSSTSKRCSAAAG